MPFVKKEKQPNTEVTQEEKMETPENLVKKAAEKSGMSEEILMAAILQMAKTQETIASSLQQNATPKQLILPEREEYIDSILTDTDNNRPSARLTYKIIGNSYGLHLHLSSKTAIYKDNKQFQLRYVKNYDTPFIEQQDGEVEIGNIDFENQYLYVTEDTCLYRFLQLHPGNEINGGRLFKLIDKKADAKKQLELIENVDRAKAYIKSLNEEELKALAKYVTEISIDGIKALSKDELKIVMLREAEKSTDKIISAKDEPRVKINYLFYTALSSGRISLSDSGKLRSDANREIVTIPAGEDAGMWIAAWAIRDDKGREFAEFLKRKV